MYFVSGGENNENGFFDIVASVLPKLKSDPDRAFVPDLSVTLVTAPPTAPNSASSRRGGCARGAFTAPPLCLPLGSARGAPFARGCVPARFAAAVRLMLVRTARAVTVAPGIAPPLSSLTLPPSVPA